MPFHDLLLRISSSLEVATLVAATTVVYLATVRHALIRQLHNRPDMASELRHAYNDRRRLVTVCAVMLVALAFAFDVRGQLFGSPSAGMRVSATAFLFIAWAVSITALLNWPEAEPELTGRAGRRQIDEPL